MSKTKPKPSECMQTFNREAPTSHTLIFQSNPKLIFAELDTGVPSQTD